MSTLDDMKEVRDILYKIGMLETMCFTLTDDNRQWIMMDYSIFFSVGASSKKRVILINYWGH